MDNKKLLNFLLKDLTEIDELFSEKNSGGFDQLELEFIQDRLKGANKLVKILIGREESGVNSSNEFNKITDLENIVETISEKETIVETISEKETVVEIKTVNQEPEKMEDPQPDQAIIDEIAEKHKEVTEEKTEVADDVELEEELRENPNKRLGDIFLKEKSVNDLLTDTNKLENRLSNLPVESIQAAIGINDRFQYIRELFEGNSGEFAKTVEQLDGLASLKEAVQYLQLNYKWKKNETSLKFVNLVKRRFSNE